MSKQENEKAYQDDNAEMVSELATLLHNAAMLAKRLERRGVPMAHFNLSPVMIAGIASNAEDAYTMGKV